MIRRRDFLRILSISAAGWATGCATSPVTGKPQLMLISEEEEIIIDKNYSPLQISNDYGQIQDKELNNYVHQVGQSLAKLTHRPHMPYSFHVVNATYVNAYAFPGGTIACTRGILLSLENEAQLAALLGHELGHVNARHTAQQISKGMLTQVVVGGFSILAGTKGTMMGQLAAQLGGIGAGVLLAAYSRENEREADALAMEYIVKGGYAPGGMVGLMDMLRTLSRDKPNVIELMFATHPMSDERYQTAVELSRRQYAQWEKLPLYRERYMDNTFKLRKLKEAIGEMQRGEREMGQKNYGGAESHFRNALKIAPEDYTALVMMAICQLVQKKTGEGLSYLEQAKQVYPQEAQAHQLSGLVRLQNKNFELAYQDFSTCEKLLPANPHYIFFKGFSLEGMGRKPEAAREYHRYLQIVKEGKYAQHAYKRLVEWGYYQR